MISSNPGVLQQTLQSPPGSSEDQIGNPAGSTTTASQGPTIINSPDISATGNNSFNSNGKIEHPSLTAPSEAALEGQIDATLAKIETMGPEMILLDMGAILGLMVKFAQEMRTTGRMDRAAHLESKLNKLLSAAEEIKKAGEATYKSAMISAALKIASGAIQIVASTIALGYALKSASAGDTSAGNAMKAKSDFAIGLSKGMDSIIDGISTMATADINLDAAKANSQRSVYEALAQGEESKSNEANEAFTMALDILRKVMDTLQSQMEAAHNTSSKITSNMI